MQTSLLPTQVFLYEYLPSRETDRDHGWRGDRHADDPAQPFVLQTKGFPGPWSRRAEVLLVQPCASSCTGLPVVAQVAIKLPWHMATSEQPSTMTTQGWCTRGMVLTGMVHLGDGADRDGHGCAHGDGARGDGAHGDGANGDGADRDGAGGAVPASC